MRDDKNAHGMFAISKLVLAFGRALREAGRPDVELATGSWTFNFMRSADAFLHSFQPSAFSLQPHLPAAVADS